MLKNNSLKIKLTIVSVILAIIPVSIVGLISYNITYNALIDNTINYVCRISSQLANNTELSINEIQRFIELGNNEATIDFLKSKNFDERTEYAQQLIDAIKLYRSMYRFNNSIIDVKIIGVNDMNFSETTGVFSLPEKERQQYIDKFNVKTGSMIFSTDIDSSNSVIDKENNFDIMVGMPIYQDATNDLLGVIILKIDTKPFVSFISNEKIGDKGFFFIIDSDNVFLTADNTTDKVNFSGAALDKIKNSNSGVFTRTVQNQKQLVIFSTVNNYNWKVVGTAYMDDLMMEANDIRWLTIYIVAVCIVLTTILYIFISSKLFVPLENLKKKMDLAAHGDLDVKLTHRSKDEIAQLNYAFNEMLRQIKELVERNRNEQENLKKSQLRVLQAQINPHFLYNTLDYIIWLTANGENDKAVETVDSLSKFFRISLSNGKDFITIYQEIEHIKNYLTIQKSRYYDILSYEINVDYKLMNHKIMKLLLQPLVENAIYHGIKPKRGGGHIQVEGFMRDQDIVFKVIDNGVGIEKAKLAKLNAQLEQGKEPADMDKNGYGLFNISERVKLYYSGNYGLSIESCVDCGTVVTLVIRSEI